MADDDLPTPIDTIRPPEAGEGTERAEAKGARSTVSDAVAERAARKKPAAPAPTTSAKTPTPESPIGENPYMRAGPEDNGPENLERARLNMVNSYYRGTAAGALALKLWSTIYKEKDGPEMDDGMREARQKIRDQYEETVLDLMRYDMMPSWSGLPQLSAAVGGTVAGAIPSPESFLGWASQGATWAARTVKAAIQQGLISGATDPIVQHLNIDAGVQKEYEPMQTVGSVAFGAGLGAGFHGAGEVAGHFIGQRELRKQITGLADVDPGLDAPYVALWRMDPRNGIQAPTPERLPATFEAAPGAATIPEWVQSPREVAAYRADTETPRPPGTVRVYHGGSANPADLDELHVTPYLQDGMGWAQRDPSMKLWYADVPADSSWLRYVDEYSGTVSRSVAPKEVLDSFKPLIPDESAPVAAPRSTGDEFADLRAEVDAIPTEAPAVSFQDAVAMEKDLVKAGRGSTNKQLNEQAQFNVFDREAGSILDAAALSHQLDPDHVRYGDIWRFYDRQAGETAPQALETAIGRWVAKEEERAKIASDDSQLIRDLDEWAAAADAEMAAGRSRDVTITPEERRAQMVFGEGATSSYSPGVSRVWEAYRNPEQEIPFESGRPDAVQSRDLPAGGAAQPGQSGGQGVAGGEPVAPVRGERGGEGLAGGEAGGAGPTLAAATDRGERLGGPNEPTGGTGAPLGQAGGDQAAAAGGQATSPKLTRNRRYIDTRGAGTQYHGSSNPDLTPDSNHYSVLNYYGQGFYSTDAIDMAGGYANSAGGGSGRGKGKEPTLYRVEETRPLNILDGEQPVTEEVRRALTPVSDYNGNPIVELLRDVGEERPGSIRELYDDVRDLGTQEGYNAGEIQEVFDSINIALRELGYDGMSHEGGRLTKNEPHRVVIYFDPENDIRLVKERFIDHMPDTVAKRLEDEVKKGQEPFPDPFDQGPADLGGVGASDRSVPVAEARNLPAKEINVAAEKMPQEVKEEFQLLWAMGANDGKTASRDVARFNQLLDEYGAEPLATERTAQGEQTLMPGVAPITERDRVGIDLGKEGGLFATPEQRTAAEKAQDIAAAEAAERKAAAAAQEADAKAQGDIFALRANRANNPMPGEERRPPSGVGLGVLSPDQEVRLRSLHQLSVELANALGVPLRQGRMPPGTSADTAGIYKTQSGVVRMRELADFEVVKHEIGHAIEARVGQDLTNLTQTHQFEMGPLDYDQTLQRANEGFAEWMRYRMTNPPAAQRLAPNFSNDFEMLMARQAPEILKVIDRTAQAHRAFLQAEPLDALATMVKNTVPLETRLFGASRKIAQEIEEEGLPPVVNTYMTKAWQWMQRRYDNFLDNMQDMERATRDLLRHKQQQQGGGLVDLPDAYNPYVLMRSARRSGQFAFTEIMNGIKDFRSNITVGPSPKDVMNEALGQPRWRDHYGKSFGLGRWNDERLEHFDQYVSAVMSKYLWERYDQGLIPNQPSPITPGLAAATIRELDAKYPTFKRAAEMLNEMYSRVRKKKFDAGLWSKEVYDLTSEYEFYVPMKRVMEDAKGTGGTRDGSILASSVRKRVGSERDIDSPLRNVMRDIFFMENDIRRNEMIGALADLAESVPTHGGEFAERLPAYEAKMVRGRLDDMIKERADEIGMTPQEAQTMIDTLLNGEDGPLVGRMFEMQRAAANGEPIVFRWVDGEPVPYRIMSRPDKLPPGIEGGRYRLFELLTEASPPVLDIYSGLIKSGGDVLRAGVTMSPVFMVKNFIRDQLMAALLEPGFIPFYHGIKGMVAEVRQNEIARMRAETGVAGGSMIGEVERKFEAHLDDMRKQGFIVKRLTSWKGFLEFISLTEMGTRNSVFEIVYKQKLKQGLSEYEAGFEARRRADDINDWSRHGDRMEWVRQNVPFMNVAMQGNDRFFFRGMIEPFIRSGFTGSKALTRQDLEALHRAYHTWLVSAAGGIAAGMAYAAMNAEKDAYRDAIPEVKGKNFIIPLPDGQVLYLPKPFEGGFGFTIGEYAHDWLAKRDPRWAASLVDALYESVKPPDPVRNMPIVTPTVELATNYSFFLKRPIVPDRLKNSAFPELEYDDKTSSLSKYIGKVMGWSPMKVDYATGALMGTNGRDILAATSMVDKDSPAAALDDTVLIRGFIKNEERVSGRAKQFWELMAAKSGKYAETAKAYRDLVTKAVERGQNPNAPNDLLKNLNSSERVFVVLKEGATDRGTPAFTADDRRMHPLNRAQEAVGVLYGVATDLQSNTLIPYREKEKIQLSPEQRRNLIDDVRTLAGQEMRNAFVVIGQPGYAGRPILDIQDQMDLIRKVSPSVAAEIETRYATAKVFNFEAVRDAWPELQREVTKMGTDANVRSLTARARSQGYEFGARRAKKPGPVRQPIPAQP
jgi:hypothetical protein